MEHEIAIQPDISIVIRDTVYRVSSSTLRQLSTPLSKLIDSCDGLLKLSATEDTEAFLYFLKSAHGTFVPQEEITSSALTELSRILRRYDIQPNTPPYDLVQFCFTRRTLRPSRLTPLDLSRMLSVARVLGNTHVKQLLLQIFERDSLHQEVELHTGDMQTTTLLANVILARNNLCVEVGRLLRISAQDVSAVAAYKSEDLIYIKALWDEAFDILTIRPSPASMYRKLGGFEVPEGLEFHVRRDEALCTIKAACNEIERWLTSKLSSEMGTIDNDCDSMGFEHLELSAEVETTRSLDSPLGSEFKDFSDDGIAYSDTEDTTPDRAQTM